MHTVSTTRTIGAPIDAVWNALDDFGNVYRFNPSVERSYTTNEVDHGKGAKRQCDFYGGGSIREEVVVRVPHERLVVDVYDNGPFPLVENVATFDLDPVDDNRTAVTVAFAFTPKYGPIGWAMAQLMMKRQFRRIADDLLAGLETHLETGAVVGRDGSPEPTDSEEVTAAAVATDGD